MRFGFHGWVGVGVLKDTVFNDPTPIRSAGEGSGFARHLFSSDIAIISGKILFPAKFPPTQYNSIHQTAGWFRRATCTRENCTPRGVRFRFDWRVWREANRLQAPSVVLLWQGCQPGREPRRACFRTRRVARGGERLGRGTKSVTGKTQTVKKTNPCFSGY